MGIIGLNLEDFPVIAAGICDGKLLFGLGAEIDVAELRTAGGHYDVATDVARDIQLHFGIEGLVERDRHGCMALAEKTMRVEGGDNGTFFVGF